MRSSILCLLFVLVIAIPNVTAIDQLTMEQFRLSYGGTVAPENSGSFVQLTDPVIISLFEELTEAMLVDDIPTAEAKITELEALDVYYRLIEITDSIRTTKGFMEDLQPGDTHYRGWGAVLFNLDSTGYVVYQAPHVFADMFTREVCLQAFYDNPNAVALQLTGAHRYSNGDDDGDSWPDSDSSHDGECLFHELTGYLAGRGVSLSAPYWFVQIHGSEDRPEEPDLVGSNCDHEPQMSLLEPLVLIDDQIDAANHILSGVWGWWEGPDDTQDGDYHLNGTANLQRYLLSTYGVSRSFMHYEMERTIRDQYNAGSGYGYDGIVHMLSAIKNVLGSSYYVPLATPTPEPTNTQQPTQVPTNTPTMTPTNTATNTPFVTPTFPPTYTPTPEPATATPTFTPIPPTNTPGFTPPPTATPTFTPIPPTNTPTATATNECVNNGDSNLDGELTAGDAQMAFQIVLGSVSPTYEQWCAADCNGDEEVTAGDAQLIFMTALGSGSCADPL